MKVITQNGKKLNVVGDVELSENNILFKNEVLGHYETKERAIEVYSMITCHSWNNKSGEFEMPKS